LLSIIHFIYEYFMQKINNNIAICVATFKRQELLKYCLSKIKLLEIPQKNSITLIIVDNDINESAKVVFNLFEKEYPFPIYYFVEPKRGIASARNRLVNEALSISSNLICFIDDDEFPKKDWLIKHFSALIKFNADVVAGPVIPITNAEHINISNFRSKLETGYVPRHVAAGNVLFKSKLVDEQNLRFDLTYNLTGGEDFHFFDRSSSKKNHHIWVSDAIIFEHITPDRKTKKYLFFRHFTGAINSVIQYRDKKSELQVWPHYTLKIIGKFFGSVITFTLYMITFKNYRLEKCIIKLASVCGYVSGLLNIIIERYR